MSLWEVGGFIAGAVSVWLYVRQSVWAWPVGLANSACWLVLFWSYRLYLDAGLQRLAGARHHALYVLTSDDIPFVQDGTRDGEHIRGWMTMRFRQELARRREPWIEVRASRSARLAAAVARIGALEDDVKGAA